MWKYKMARRKFTPEELHARLIVTIDVSKIGIAIKARGRTMTKKPLIDPIFFCKDKLIKLNENPKKRLPVSPMKIFAGLKL